MSLDPTTPSSEHLTSADAVPNNIIPIGSDTKQDVVTPIPKKRSMKKILFVLSAVLIVGLAGGITVFILSRTTQQTTQSATKTPVQQAAELAKQANDAATASANQGDTAGALAHYKEALVQYQKAGDKAGEEGVKLQIQYYEQVKANEDKAKAEAAASSSTNQ